MPRPQRQRPWKQDVVFLVHVLMHVALQAGERVIHGPEGVAGPIRRRVTVGQFCEPLQRRAGLFVFLLELHERRLECGNRGGPVFGSGLQPADRRKHVLLFVLGVREELGLEGLEQAADLVQARFVIAMHGGHLARHEIQARQFLAQVGVMGALDVIARLGKRHGVRMSRCGLGDVVQCRQHGDHGRGVEALAAAGFGERFLAAAAVIDAQFLEDPRAGRHGADEFSDGGFNGDGLHVFPFGQRQSNAPAVSGHEPKFQRAGVNLLFLCLLLIVVGSLYGTWAGTRQKMRLGANFWFGHQGYEYVDLGRFWQLFLFVGLWLWLFLMGRALWPAFKQPGEHRHLLALFQIASTAIALFYSAGLMWGRQTHYAIAEYWRWWVVHLWVEGFFEVFATVVIAFPFTRMGLLRTITATAAVLFSTTIFLAGGIIGTFHHLYFSGTPTAVMALGAVFSALEVVPLVLIGFEAYENLTLSRARKWVSAYRWPIYCFVAVAFWNLVGAGLFGFLINPPIVLYYMQGLNTTAVHGHTALFGVYAMLGIGLMLFCLKGLTVRRTWRTRPLAFAFWAINLGLALMVLLSDLPRGLLQTVASVNEGMWWARSAEFTQSGIMQTLRWLRVIGDTIFGVGALVLGWFVLGIKTGWSLTETPDEIAQQFPELATMETVRK